MSLSPEFISFLHINGSKLIIFSIILALWIISFVEGNGLFDNEKLNDVFTKALVVAGSCYLVLTVFYFIADKTNDLTLLLFIKNNILTFVISSVVMSIILTTLCGINLYLAVKVKLLPGIILQTILVFIFAWFVIRDFYFLSFQI